ncbi:MAG: hypothetical protein LBN07_00765 [Christensenellaceae bacterium]|jgi:hypothetical protein|nr:hypothetical protein [Christensenellaceae bacterium]
MISKLVDFYIDYAPFFSEWERSSDLCFGVSKYVKDHDSNFVFVRGNNPDIKKIESWFSKRKIIPAIYEIEDHFIGVKEKLKDYIIKTQENWFVFDNIKKLKDRFEKLVVPPEITFERADENSQAVVRMVSKLGFSSVSFDNPYSDLGTGWLMEMWEQFTTRLSKTTSIYLIKYRDEYAGQLVLSTYKDMSYISGFTIIPKFRRTRVALSLKLILDLLIQQKVKTIFCKTAEGGYPEKLYRHIGLKKVFCGKIWVKQNKK